MNIELPDAPRTVEEAVRKANAIAYGFEKHTDVTYWNPRYYGDPPYFWKRLLGWQAGGDDVARAGLYANPPIPWLTDTAAPPPPPPPPPPPTDGNWDDGGTDFDLVAFLARLNELEANIQHLQTLLIAVRDRPWPTYSGKLLGYAFSLTPSTPKSPPNTTAPKANA